METATDISEYHANSYWRQCHSFLTPFPSPFSL